MVTVSKLLGIQATSGGGSAGEGFATVLLTSSDTINQGDSVKFTPGTGIEKFLEPGQNNNNYDISGLVDAGDSKLTDPALTNMSGARFSKDGSKMWVCSAGQQRIYEYDLPTPFSPSSAGTATTSLLIGSNLRGFWVNDAESKLYTVHVVNSSSTPVREYNISGFNLSTASLQNTLAATPNAGNEGGIQVSADGTKLWIEINITGAAIEEYTLSTPFDISTAGAPTSYLLPQSGIKGFQLSDTGETLYLISTSADAIQKYTLGTAFDLSTIPGTANQAVSISNPVGFNFIDSTNLLVARDNGSVYKYTGHTVESTAIIVGASISSQLAGEFTAFAEGFSKITFPGAVQGNTFYLNENGTVTLNSGDTLIGICVFDDEILVKYPNLEA